MLFRSQSINPDFRGTRKWSINPPFVIGILIATVIMLVGIALDGRAAIITPIMALTILVGVGVISVRAQLSHPFVWFGPVFLLYSISAPLLFILDRYRYYESYHDVLILEFVALVSFMCVVGTKRQPIQLEQHANTASEQKIGGHALFFCSVALIIFYLLFMMQSGFASKLERNISGNPLFKMDFIFTFANVGLSIVTIYSLRYRKKMPWTYICPYAVLLVLALLIIGERDLLFRFLVTAFIIYTVYVKNITLRSLVILGVIFGVLSTMMGLYKGLFLEGSLRSVGIYAYLDGEYGLRDLMALLLGSEFRSGSENLAQLVMIVPEERNYFFGSGFLMELRSAFNLGFLSTRDSALNLSNWFASTYHTNFFEMGGGVGFSLVGQGYVDFGMGGVVALFMGIGFLVRSVHSWSARSFTGMIFYVNFAPIMLMSIRQTIALIVSQPFKHILLPLLLVALFSKIMQKATNRSDAKMIQSNAFFVQTKK